MKIAMIHFSDMHFKKDSNYILDRSTFIYNALSNILTGADKAFFVLTGDIAFSGREDEYYQAMKFFDFLNDSIKNEMAIEVYHAIIPGNHDCDFNIPNMHTRNTIIEAIVKKRAVETEFIELCCQTQTDFNEFKSCYENEESRIFNDPLLWVSNFQFDDYNIIFHCYNSSWISQKEQKPGCLYYPIQEPISKSNLNRNNTLIISLIHHPFNWFIPENARELRKHIEQNSHFVLTGHEHESTKAIKDNLDGIQTEYIEGAVLQGDDPQVSGFNVIILDLNKKQHQIYQYSWMSGFYTYGKQEVPWLPTSLSIKNGSKSLNINSAYYKNFLSEPGVQITHPQKQDVTLDDIFIYPYLKEVSIDNDLLRKRALNNFITSEGLLKLSSDKNKIFILGSEKSGKTSLCKAIFKYAHRCEFTPIYVQGNKIISRHYEDFTKIIRKSVQEQYENEILEFYEQLQSKNKVIIIDDFHKCRLNKKFRALLLAEINRHYNHVIIAASDLYEMEEIIDKSELSAIYKDFRQLKIIEFGHVLRDKFIRKWKSLGREELISEGELIKQSDDAKRIIDVIIGNNYVPSYPIFLLIILQAIDAGTSHNLSESTYGHYYEILILRALTKVDNTTGGVELYANYLSEYAYYMFRSRNSALSIKDYEEFHNEYCREYQLKLDSASIIESLKDAAILSQFNDVFGFRYRYMYYYFVAKYFANNIANELIQEQLRNIFRHLYIEEYANIALFLTHHTKHRFVIEEIASSAKIIFSKFQPIELDRDIDIVNTLMREGPKISIVNKEVNETRSNIFQQRDEIEMNRDEDIDSDAELNGDYDETKTFSELHTISQLNYAFKTIEVIGQILKNYYGSLKGDDKYSLAYEAYLISFRALASFFSILENHKDHIESKIRKAVERKKLDEPDKIDAISRHIIFQICGLVTFGFVKKVSISVGSERLSVTLDEILNDHDSNSIALVNMSMRLEHYEAFPYEEIKKMKRRFERNPLATMILKTMVIEYLYMFPTTYTEKQKICNTLDIPIESQRLIDVTSIQKKRS